MTRICCVCKVKLGESEGEGVSHGYCRFDELEAYERDEIITPDEQRELNAMRHEKRKEAINGRRI